MDVSALMNDINEDLDLEQEEESYIEDNYYEPINEIEIPDPVAHLDSIPIN
jgi:hypothetical protein